MKTEKDQQGVVEPFCCSVVGEYDNDYIVRLTHNDGRSMRLLIPKDFDSDNEKDNTIENGKITGLNCVMWGHYM